MAEELSSFLHLPNLSPASGALEDGLRGKRNSPRGQAAGLSKAQATFAPSQLREVQII